MTPVHILARPGRGQCTALGSPPGFRLVGLEMWWAQGRRPALRVSQEPCLGLQEQMVLRGFYSVEPQEPPQGPTLSSLVPLGTGPLYTPLLASSKVMPSCLDQLATVKLWQHPGMMM